jgi:hypothetical protein
VVHRLFHGKNEGFLKLDEDKKHAAELSRFTDFAPKDLAEIRG